METNQQCIKRHKLHDGYEIFFTDGYTLSQKNDDIGLYCGITALCVTSHDKNYL